MDFSRTGPSTCCSGWLYPSLYNMPEGRTSRILLTQHAGDVPTTITVRGSGRCARARRSGCNRDGSARGEALVGRSKAAKSSYRLQYPPRMRPFSKEPPLVAFLRAARGNPHDRRSGRERRAGSSRVRARAFRARHRASCSDCLVDLFAAASPFGRRVSTRGASPRPNPAGSSPCSTLGVIAIGATGRRLARWAQALVMRVLVGRPSRRVPAGEGVEQRDALAAGCG